MNGTMRAPAAPRAHWRAARPSIGGCAPRPSQLPCRRRLSPRCAPLDRASTLAAEQEQQQQEQAQIEQQQQHEQQPLQPVDEASPQPRQEQQQAEGVGVTVRRLLSLAGPLALQNVVGYSTSIVGLSYVGSMGPTVLAAYLLAASLYNLIGLSLALGLTTALDTLAGAVRAALQVALPSVEASGRPSACVAATRTPHPAGVRRGRVQQAGAAAAARRHRVLGHLRARGAGVGQLGRAAARAGPAARDQPARRPVSGTLLHRQGGPRAAAAAAASHLALRRAAAVVRVAPGASLWG